MKTAEEKIDEYYPEISDKDNNREYTLSLKDFREIQRGAFMVGYNAAKEEDNLKQNDRAFEYCLVKYDVTDDDVIEKMNEMEENGWEIMKITDSIEIPYVRVYYKRIK